MKHARRFTATRVHVLSWLATLIVWSSCAVGAPRPDASLAGKFDSVVVKPLLPEAASNDEQALLARAKAAEVTTLEGGYRQVDLVVARVATWEGERDLQVRLFLPPVTAGEKTDKPAMRPLVAYVHGGGFIGGNPEMNLLSNRGGFHQPVRALLDEGFAVASLGYRLAREAGWPAPISDTLCGLRFLKKHGEHWGVDGSRIGICGHSAGARIAALLGMVPQDQFHNQSLPWQEETVVFAGVWLWAGSPWTAPQVDQWEEFGKPRDFSVMRLHFGEHPAWDDMARHRLRLRNNLPHLSNAMPPLHLLRGESDYGGDHSDAKRAVEIWKALGIDAELTVVRGGHNSTGPTRQTVQCFKQHLVTKPFTAPAHDPVKTASILLKQNEPAAALEVLNAAYTDKQGTAPPRGQWVILTDGQLIWLPVTNTWTEEARTVAQQAKRALAESEMKAAKTLLKRQAWFRARSAADNVQLLAGDDALMEDVLKDVRAASQHEASVFRMLAKANARVHAGKSDEALRLLATLDDARTKAAAKRLKESREDKLPSWASRGGVDVYGRWAELKLADGVSARLRWVPAGTWDLPEHLRYRNTTDEPWVSRIHVEHGFWLAETPTTVAQWQAVLADDESDLPKHPNVPQTGIDYLRIVDWLQRLSGTHEDMVARLPGEQEWLHAYTLGGRTDTEAATDLHAVHALNVNPESPGPLPVNEVLPGLGGFQGMLGGVHEWTGSPGRHTARFNDPKGRFRVLAYPIARGGAWSSMPHALSPAIRTQQRHGNRQPDLGFRFVIGGGPDAAEWLSHVERK